MTDFTPPFGEEANKRAPTADERENGFPCGPFDRALFTGLIYLLEGNIKEVADQAGEVPSQDLDITLLHRSIQALIDAATGGGTADNYATMGQLRTRLPIYPEVLGNDGHLGITSPGTGQIRIPASKTIMHRGVYPFTTALLDIATDPSKTYHLRADLSAGALVFSLKDLADTGSYNPATLAETVPSFDSGFDDALFARIVTNSSNVPTITNLINRPRLSAALENSFVANQALEWTTQAGTGLVLNWARTPVRAQVYLRDWGSSGAPPSGGAMNEATVGRALAAGVRMNPSGATRYAIPDVQREYQDNKGNDGYIGYGLLAMGE